MAVSRLEISFARLRAWLRVGCVQAVLSVQSVECVGEEVLSRWLEVGCGVIHYKVH